MPLNFLELKHWMHTGAYKEILLRKRALPKWGKYIYLEKRKIIWNFPLWIFSINVATQETTLIIYDIDEDDLQGLTTTQGLDVNWLGDNTCEKYLRKGWACNSEPSKVFYETLSGSLLFYEKIRGDIYFCK